MKGLPVDPTRSCAAYLMSPYASRRAQSTIAAMDGMRGAHREMEPCDFTSAMMEFVSRCETRDD